MEKQPRFDLSNALLAWRNDLAAQPGIGADDIRELEMHLLESFSALQRRGLSDEEAFAQAWERLGSAGAVGAEFAKAHTLRIWRDRVFWIALLGCLTGLFASATEHPLMEFARWLQGRAGTFCAVLTGSALACLPTLLMCALMASGHAERVFRRSSWLFSKRRRLGAFGAAAVIAANLFTYRHTGVLLIYELGFLGFAALVMPRELRAAAAAKFPGQEHWRNSLGIWRDRLFWVLLADLAVGVWTMLMVTGANGYLFRLPESQRASLPLLVSVLFFLVWLGPMGLAGLGLWTGHLSVISRAIRSRWLVGLLASGLMLLNAGAKFWLLTWNVSTSRFSVADWRFAHLVDGVA
ncbi:MAG: permease prefix domain 1-containing protein, partial [Limisphaerales bacterium]